MQFPEVGRTYRLDESEYRFGKGPLLVRVVRVVSEVVFDGEVWWSVEAVVKHPQGTGPGHERHLYLRLKG